MAYFDPGSVIWELESSDKYEAIREIIFSAPIFTEHDTLNLDDFAQRVFDRERIQSTGFGHGVAVAHGRTTQVEHPTVAVGISREGIDYEAIDGEPVHLLFIVANRPDQQMDYLRFLSTLVGMVRDEMFRRDLLSCTHMTAAQEKLCSVFSRLIEKQALPTVTESAS